MNFSAAKADCVSESGPSCMPSNSVAGPDYDGAFNMSNGLFNLEVELQGPPDSPPFLARLYCKKDNLGRFMIHLTENSDTDRVKMCGGVNVRYGDVIEWCNNGLKNLGLIDEKGKLLKLGLSYYCKNFQASLKNYLKSRRMEILKPYISA